MAENPNPHIDPELLKPGNRYPQWLIDAAMRDAMKDDEPPKEEKQKELPIAETIAIRGKNESKRSFKKRVRREYAKLFGPRYRALMREYNDMIDGGMLNEGNGYYNRYNGTAYGRWR